MARHHRRAQYARRRLHDDDERHQRHARPARRRRRGPTNTADQQHRPADDRHVRAGHRREVRQPREPGTARWCRPTARRCHRGRGPEASPLGRRARRPVLTRRTHCVPAAPPAGSARPRPSVGSPVADRTATVRSRRVGLEIRALNAAGWPAVSSANPTTDAKTTTRPDISSASTACSDPRNINLPPPSERGVSLGVTMTAVTSPKRSHERMVSHLLDA